MYSKPNAPFNTAPNAFLTEVVQTLKPGRALEIGMGQGRNSLYLAKLGWDVTGFDISETGMSLARKSAADAGVKLRTINQSIEAFDYGVDQWDSHRRDLRRSQLARQGGAGTQTRRHGRG